MPQTKVTASLFARRQRLTASCPAGVCETCGMLRMMSFRTGQPNCEPALNLDDEVPRATATRRTAPDDGARKRTVRGLLMVMRLRVEITTREAAQSADLRIEEARQELRVLTGGTD